MKPRWVARLLGKVVCPIAGHNQVGPRKGDGRAICWRCYKVLIPGRYDHLSKSEQMRVFLESESNLVIPSNAPRDGSQDTVGADVGHERTL